MTRERMLPIVRRTLGGWSVVALLALAVWFSTIPRDTASDAIDTAESGERLRPPASADPRPDGPGTTEPGIQMIATPMPDGTIDVSEVVLYPVPTAAVGIAPPDVARVGGAFASTTTTVTNVQITADGQSIAEPRGSVDGPVSIALPTASRRVEVRYEVVGAVARSEPSTAGRALAALAPLTDGVPDDLPVAITVTGDSVRNLSCPTRSLALQACAAGSQPRLMVHQSLPWRDALVIVQLDMSTSL